jgi:hypothetical protein
MAWRGSTTVNDRIFASLPYLLPIIDSLGFGFFLLNQFPLLGIILLPLQPVIIVYGMLGPFASLIVFAGLMIFVIRNERIHHFIRFNSMQAIYLSIVSFLFGLFLKLFTAIPGADFALQTFSTLFFLSLFLASIYGIIQVFMGRYAEIPIISEQVYQQVR